MWPVRGIVIVLPILGLITALGFEAGCDPETRYKVLTLFFDGVPAPGSAEAAAEQSLVTIGQAQVSDSELVATSDLEAQKRGSRHPPARDCQRCHAEGARWGRKQFKKPVPALCYDCHTQYSAATQAVIHGPVAVGVCLFCHNPHESGYANLQRKPEPELCYQCHQQEDVMDVADHQAIADQVCTQCHDPHISPFEKLLTPSFIASEASGAN